MGPRDEPVGGFGKAPGPRKSWGAREPDSYLSQAEWTSERMAAPPSWPQEGRVEFRGYSLRYRSDMDPVLRDISIVVHGGEKVSSRQPHLCRMEGGREDASCHWEGGGSREAGEVRSSFSAHLNHWGAVQIACAQRGSCVARPLQGP